MTRFFGHRHLRSWRQLTWLAAALLLLLAPSAARADVVLNVESVNVSAGSTGNVLDVTLTNTGPSSITVGGFSFEISTPTANINFTDATISTALAPYIFAGHSAFGPSIQTGTGQVLDASDVFFPFGSGATVGAGVTVGLGHAVFNVAPGTASGPITVSFTGSPTTGLSDPNGGNIPITTFNTGTITVAGTPAVPEPSGAAALGVTMLFGLAARSVRQRMRQPSRLATGS